MQKVTKVQIKDLEGVQHFQIRLFDVMEGLAFLDRFVASKERSINGFLKDLLPLATLLDTQGTTPVTALSFENVGTYFESPIAVLELGIKILEHQMVFMKSSEIFREYVAQVEKLLPMKISEKVTQSATS